jgi:hypothetical protein
MLIDASSTGTVSQNVFSDSDEGAIATLTGGVNITQNTFSGDNTIGVHSFAGDAVVYAKGNWWGSAEGPSGGDAAVNVDYAPYVTDGSDRDGDGIPDALDQCDASASDSIGNRCDHDEDDDGVVDGLDACPFNPNDGVGNPCRHDEDGDGIHDDADVCPFDAVHDAIGNPCNHDEDGDGIHDAADVCPFDAVHDAIGDPCNHDEDGDGVGDAQDRCPTEAGSANGCSPVQATINVPIASTDPAPEAGEVRVFSTFGGDLPESFGWEMARFTVVPGQYLDIEAGVYGGLYVVAVFFPDGDGAPRILPSQHYPGYYGVTDQQTNIALYVTSFDGSVPVELWGAASAQ